MMKNPRILTKKYDVGKELGEGNFSKVYYAKNRKTGQEVAIKVIDKGMILKRGLDIQMKREITVMGKLRHRNILKVYEVLASRSKIYLVLEYAQGGELYKRVDGGRLRENLARYFFQQLISAVDFCHSRGVYHRDLKLENLLLDESGRLLVSDFGLSMFVEPNRENGLMLNTVCGTPPYVAPEVLSRKIYDGAKSDTWSCGVILFAMLAGHLPFRDSSLYGLYRKIKNAEYRCPNWFPPEVNKLLSRILDPNPKTRISTTKILQNAWFKKGLGTKPANIIEDVTMVEQEPRSIRDMNAFEIITMSSGFDLTGLFVPDSQREQARFSSQKPACDIVLRLKEVADEFGMKMTKNDQGDFSLVRLGQRESDSVRLDVEVLELTKSSHLVELKKASGDSLVYQKLMTDMKLALDDIVCAWQGNLQISEPDELIL